MVLRSPPRVLKSLSTYVCSSLVFDHTLTITLGISSSSSLLSTPDRGQKQGLTADKISTSLHLQ